MRSHVSMRWAVTAFMALATIGVAQARQPNQIGVCPMKVPGTKVTVANVRSGVALSFTTKNKRDVAELRQSVDQMARMHNKKHAKAEKPMMMPASTASVKDIHHGARITLVPKNPAQLKVLQADARKHAAQMNAERGCPMMARRQGQRAL